MTKIEFKKKGSGINFWCKPGAKQTVFDDTIESFGEILSCYSSNLCFIIN